MSVLLHPLAQDLVGEMATELLRPDLRDLPVPRDTVLPYRPHAERGPGKAGRPYGLGQLFVTRRIHPQGIAHRDGVGRDKELARNHGVGEH